MNQTTSTRCPSCGAEFDVNELLYQELDQQAQQKYQAKFAEQQARLKQQEQALQSQQQALQSTVQEQVKAQLQQKLETETTRLKKQAEQDQAERIKSMQAELDEQSKRIVQLNKAQSEIERLKREKQTLRSEIELDVEKRFSQQLAKESDKIQQQVEQQLAFKVAEKEQVINQLKDQLNQAQRKADQGSSQLQGEIQELAIEEWLKTNYPLDDIEEIKKGATGADTIQVVHTQRRSNCGTIYYESKRTKNFQPAWIAKFKADIQTRNADIGVLVTEVMPDNMDTLGQIDGIWVCTFDEFKNLSTVLRQSLIQISQALIVQENKGDKMGMLYDYLTGNEFRMQIEAIVEGFTQLKSDLESEKRSMQGIWKKREKQIERVLLNTNFMYNSVKGIAGSAVQNIPLLELRDEEE